MTSVKPRRQNVPIVTSRDMNDIELHHEYLRERSELERKVKHWEKKVEMFGGEIHKETLAKFSAKLAAL